MARAHEKTSPTALSSWFTERAKPLNNQLCLPLRPLLSVYFYINLTGTLARDNVTVHFTRHRRLRREAPIYRQVKARRTVNGMGKELLDQSPIALRFRLGYTEMS